MDEEERKRYEHRLTELSSLNLKLEDRIRDLGALIRVGEDAEKIGDLFDKLDSQEKLIKEHEDAKAKFDLREREIREL